MSINTSRENRIGLNILLIEDDSEDVVLVQEMLASSKELDFNLSYALRVQKGYEYLTTRKFDLIILDLNLPDCYGVDTIHRIKQIIPTIPILIITGSTLRTDEINECIILSDGYLVKGYFNSNNLIHKILESIENKNEHNFFNSFLDNNKICKTNKKIMDLKNQLNL